MKDYLILHMKKYKKWNLIETARQNHCDGKTMQKYSSLTLEEHQQHRMKLYQDDDVTQIKITNIIKQHPKARIQIYSKTTKIPLRLKHIPSNKTQVDWDVQIEGGETI